MRVWIRCALGACTAVLLLVGCTTADPISRDEIDILAASAIRTSREDVFSYHIKLRYVLRSRAQVTVELMADANEPGHYQSVGSPAVHVARGEAELEMSGELSAPGRSNVGIVAFLKPPGRPRSLCSDMEQLALPR